MSMLDVDGAELNYDIAGDGPLLILVPGAGGDGGIFKPTAHYLQSDFAVVTYDRRGLAGSRLTGEQDYSLRVKTDAADIAKLIRHLDRGPAIVFGSSSGGVVALQFMTDHPEAFSHVLAHEPAAIKALPDSEARLAGIDATYEAYHAHGLQAAIGGFVMAMMSASDQKTLAANAGHGDPAQMAKNMDYWFEHELRQYPRTEFDWDAITRDAARLMLVVGEDTEGLPPHVMATTIAAKVGAPVKTLPGGHVGYATYPEAFARALTALLV